MKRLNQSNQAEQIQLFGWVIPDVFCAWCLMPYRTRLAEHRRKKYILMLGAFNLESSKLNQNWTMSKTFENRCWVVVIDRERSKPVVWYSCGGCEFFSVFLFNIDNKI